MAAVMRQAAMKALAPGCARSGAALALKHQSALPTGSTHGTTTERNLRRDAIEAYSQAAVHWREALRAHWRALPLPLAEDYIAAALNGNSADYGVALKNNRLSQLQHNSAIARQFASESATARVRASTRAAMVEMMRACPLSTHTLVTRSEEAFNLIHERHKRVSEKELQEAFGTRSGARSASFVDRATALAGAWRFELERLAELWRPWLGVIIGGGGNFGVEFEMLVQEGWMRVQRGLDLYQPRPDVRAFTYCYTWLRMDTRSAITKKRATLARGIGTQASSADADGSMDGEGRGGLPAEREGHWLAEFYSIISQGIPASLEADPVVLVVNLERDRLIHKSISQLPVIQQRAVRFHYGLTEDSNEELSYIEIGARMGFSKQRAQVLVANGIKGLRDYLVENPNIGEALHATMMDA